MSGVSSPMTIIDISPINSPTKLRIDNFSLNTIQPISVVINIDIALDIGNSRIESTDLLISVTSRLMTNSANASAAPHMSSILFSPNTTGLVSVVGWVGVVSSALISIGSEVEADFLLR